MNIDPFTALSDSDSLTSEVSPQAARTVANIKKGNTPSLFMGE
jgi:hypothetical protein